jgi:polysaccharide chain length determinant protein (PEP-CTERM system associated)
MKQSPTLQLDDLQNLFDNQGSGQQESQLDIGYYVNLVLRRRWFVIIPFFLALIAGIYLAVSLPKKFQAETLILIEPQRVPDNYVQAIVSSDLESRIATIKEMILSRTNLIKIMDNFNIFTGPKYVDMFLDEKIEAMRKYTTVDIVSDRRNRTANAFKITFEAEEPRMVMQVVNAMATLVIDQNLKARESQATGTVEFLENELVKMRRKLEEVEAALKNFRETHMGELPDQLASNLMVLERLQQQLSDKQKSIRDEKNRLSTLENQLQFAREQAAMTVTTPALPENREPTTLEGLRQQLADFKLRYTPQHPDVIRLQRKVEELEKENPPLSANSADTGSSRTAGGVGLPATGRGVEADLITQRNSAAREIVAIREELSALQEQIAVYQRRVEDTPKLEQELLSLKRDYDNTQKTYDSLLARKQEAEVAANMERQQKGEQFRILDAARLPDKPQSPDMRKLFLMCVMAGLGLGAGLIFLLEFLDKSVKKLESVPKKLGIPLLVAVPRIDHPKDVRKRRINDGLSIAAAVICMALMALFAAVSVLGMQGPTELVKKILT